VKQKETDSADRVGFYFLSVKRGTGGNRDRFHLAESGKLNVTRNRNGAVCRKGKPVGWSHTTKTSDDHITADIKNAAKRYGPVENERVCSN